MSEHATETLFVVLHPDGWSIQTKQEGCGLAVARQYGNSDVSNARRLVACWNKFDGMTTDQIERMPGTVQWLGETFMASDQHRTLLLNALEQLFSLHEPEGRFQPSHFKPILRLVRETLATVKGGAA